MYYKFCLLKKMLHIILGVAFEDLILFLNLVKITIELIHPLIVTKFTIIFIKYSCVNNSDKVRVELKNVTVS